MWRLCIHLLTSHSFSVCPLHTCIEELQLASQTNICTCICSHTLQCFYMYVFICEQDGIITDMKNTVDRIVHASSLPLSIVIVGVGGADFSNMVCMYYVLYTHNFDEVYICT